MTLRFGRQTSTSAVHATKQAGDAVTTNGSEGSGSVDDANSDSSEHYGKTTANECIDDRMKLMNSHNETGDRRLFNADRMLKATNHPVIASLMILTMTDVM